LEVKDMNTTSKYLNRVAVVLAVTGLCLTAAPGFTTEARAHSGAAFLGGMLAGHVVTGAVSRDKQRTQAAEYQAYSQPRSAPAAQSSTPEQKIDQLNKLAAGGYITPAEYKAKKQAILNSM
jgi:hypothetical protein